MITRTGCKNTVHSHSWCNGYLWPLWPWTTCNCCASYQRMAQGMTVTAARLPRKIKFHEFHGEAKSYYEFEDKGNIWPGKPKSFHITQTFWLINETQSVTLVHIQSPDWLIQLQWLDICWLAEKTANTKSPPPPPTPTILLSRSLFITRLMSY